MTGYRAARIFTGHEVVEDGVLLVGPSTSSRAETLAVVSTRSTSGATGAELINGELASGELASGDVIDLGDVTLVPGLVDVHSHGGGGSAVSENPVGVAVFHAAHGTTTYVGSLVTGTLDTIEGQVRALAPSVADGTLAGLHLEGPWLSERYHGAHPTELLRDPLPGEVARLCEAGGDAVRMVTIAVEREGALDSVRWMAEHGIVAALGHSDCSYDDARAALDAGATGATHLFNAMPALLHRAPGPVLALLRDPRAWLELIADGVHVHPDVVTWVLREHPDRTVLVTDAMAAAGCSDGDYVLGELAVEVRNGQAHIAGTDTIAGSTLVLADAVRNTIGWGVDWVDAVRAATLNPALYLGLPGVGELAPGSRADAVALASDWTVSAVLKDGVLLG